MDILDVQGKRYSSAFRRYVTDSPTVNPIRLRDRDMRKADRIGSILEHSILAGNMRVKEFNFEEGGAKQ